mgnify:CR=1 FL=1
MRNFTQFLESMQFDPQSVVQAAIQARADEGIAGRATFGDCKAVCNRLASLLRKLGVVAQLKGGQFICDPNDEIHYDHSWLIVGGDILDPTVDQFFSDLDFDLSTQTPGVYFSHPECDGDWLTDRYR